MTPLTGRQFLEFSEAALVSYASQPGAAVRIPGVYLASVVENLRVLQGHGRIVVDELKGGETGSPPGAPGAFEP